MANITKQASTRFSIVKRSKGQSAVEKASYISRSILVSEYDGQTYRPKYHEDLVHSEISLPQNAPREYADRATLWNAVELSEKGQKSQLARMLKASLPNEWSYELAEEVVRDYVQRNFVDKGMCADWAIHDSENDKGQRKDLLKMPAVKSTKNPDGTRTITESTVNEIHKVLRSCFRQAVKWDMMEKNPAVDATVPKAKKQEREIWTAEMLMQALEACDNKMLKIAFHLAFTATLRIGELLGLTWDDMDISEEAIADNKAYVIINKQVERVSKDAIEALNSKEIIMIFPSQKKNNRTVRVLKTPKTAVSGRCLFQNQ